jgi:hypothetical protein
VPMRNNKLRSEKKNISSVKHYLLVQLSVSCNLCIQWFCTLIVIPFTCTTDFHNACHCLGQTAIIQGLYSTQTLSPPLNTCSNQAGNGEWLLNWQTRKFILRFSQQWLHCSSIQHPWHFGGLWRWRQFVPPKRR